MPSKLNFLQLVSSSAPSFYVPNFLQCLLNKYINAFSLDFCLFKIFISRHHKSSLHLQILLKHTYVYIKDMQLCTEKHLKMLRVFLLLEPNNVLRKWTWLDSKTVSVAPSYMMFPLASSRSPKYLKQNYSVSRLAPSLN